MAQQTVVAELIGIRLLVELDPRCESYDIGRGARGTYHIVPTISLSSGRLHRAHDTTLCRGRSVTSLGYRQRWQAPTCMRCLETADRLSVKQILFRARKRIS